MNNQIIVIGSGIAAKCVIFELNNLGFENIISIASDNFSPACSKATTAINTLRGTQRGLTPLGETLVDAHEAFEAFFSLHKPLGVVKSVEVHGWLRGYKKLLRRYKEFKTDKNFPFFKNSFNSQIDYSGGDAYIISPDIFMEWFDKKLKYKKIEDFVVAIDKTSVVTQNNLSFKFDQLIFASGFMAKSFSFHILDPKGKKSLTHSKAVSGSYLEFDANLFHESSIELDNSFSFVFEDTHLVYKKEMKKILIGSTSFNNKISFMEPVDELNKKYLKLQNLIGEKGFPNISNAKIRTGVRHKSQSREPYGGQCNTKLFGVWGLYKNGWSSSFLIGKKVASDVLKSIQNHGIYKFDFAGQIFYKFDKDLNRELYKEMESSDYFTLENASDKRLQEFRAGRFLAKKALLDFEETENLERGERGEPIWPKNFSGSITHSKKSVYVSVIKNEKDNERFIGIDSEMLVSNERFFKIKSRIAKKEDLKLLEYIRENKAFSQVRETIFNTLVFSAKESLYKLIYPQTLTFFGFEHAYLKSINFEQESFVIILDSSIEEVKPFNGEYEGRYLVSKEELLSFLIQ